MLISSMLVILGILYILIPHFVLPLSYIKGSSESLLLSECSIGYHPALYLGIMLIIIGIIRLKYKRAIWLAFIVIIAGLLQSYFLRPVSFYLQSQDLVVTLAQTYSIRAHMHIREIIAILSLLTALITLLALLMRKKTIQFLTITYIALSNLRRRPLRTVALVVGLTIAIGIFFSYVLLSRGIENTLEIGAGRLGADIMVVPKMSVKPAETVLLSGTPTLFYLNKDVIDKLKGYSEIERLSPQLYLQPFTQLVCCIAERFLIIAYDPETDFTVAPWIRYKLKGRLKDYNIVVGHSVKYYPGQEMMLYGRKLRVVATLDPTGLGYFDKSVFIPLDIARKMLRALKRYEEKKGIPQKKIIQDESYSHLINPSEDTTSVKDIRPDAVSAVFLKLKPHIPAREFAKKIESDIDGIGTVVVKESTLSVKRQISSLLNTFAVPIVILLLMCTLILGVVFNMSVKERQREIGLLRAMGSYRSNIFRLVITESIVIAFFGALWGTVFGSTIFFVFKNKVMAALNLLYVWPSLSIISSVLFITVITSLLVGLLSGLYPALRASTMEPYLAIRTGER